MAHVETGASGAQKGKGPRGKSSNSMNFELNLVPMIDLLSVCICFLLLTAVWTQTATLQVDAGTRANTARKSSQTTSAKNELEVVIRISNKGEWVVLQKSGKSFLFGRNELKDGSFLASVQEAQFVTIAPQHGVAVQDVVTTIDVLKSAKIPKVQIEAGA